LLDSHHPVGRGSWAWVGRTPACDGLIHRCASPYHPRVHTRIVALSTVAAVAFAVGCYVPEALAVLGDAHGSHPLRRPRGAGWMGAYSIATVPYGFPAVVAPWAVLFGPSIVELHHGVFATSLTIHLIACYLIARRLGVVVGSARLATVAHAVAVLNPFLLISAREVLRESLSASVIALADVEVPVAYVKNLDPWYRWPLLLLNYGYLGLGLVGTAQTFALLREQAVGETRRQIVQVTAPTEPGCHVPTRRLIRITRTPVGAPHSVPVRVGEPTGC